MRRGLAAALGALAVALLMAVAPARAEDPPFVGWPSALPPTVKGFTPSRFTACADGSPTCVDATLAEMRRLLAELDATCDHRALFLRNYLTVTEHYVALPDGFFEDDRWLAHEDAVFAELYFQAFDDHAAGRRSKVPEAWRIAFDAARDKRVEGAGDLLLGINAHVQRDMPFMLAGLGLVAPGGRSRKPDHDAMNAVLNASYDDVYRRATVMDDPALALYDPPGWGEGLLAFQLVAGWREVVWRNAQRLVKARTPAAKARVARSIEDQAAGTAKLIRTAFTYKPPLTTPAARQANCRARPQDPGPGTPPANLSAKDLVRLDLGSLSLRVPLP
ncbi:DUF5995 family protein [Conexibacter sp. SYSU D00693]|uniref:DUF5995 family protein n=1 Tax=Conexibacter sp. SYSU D00693 TaxID=2812560 RepID=UPI00196A6E32|nr:DUF5995 family protein [Conexibacter sp. SYSU D00693]